MTDDSSKPTTVHLDRTSGDSAVFVPHGRYDAEYADGLVFDRASGPFNLEMLQAYARHSAPLYAQALAEAPFVSLTVFLQDMMMPREAMDGLQRYVRQLAATAGSICAVAHVASLDVDGRKFIGGQFERFYREIGIPYRLFETEPEARQWLAGQLAAARAAQR